MSERATRIHKKITEVKKVLTQLIKEYDFYCGEKCEEDYKDIRTKAIYFICLELDEIGLNHEDFVKESYEEKYKVYKGGWKSKRESYVLSIVGKKINQDFEDAIERARVRLSRRLEMKKKQIALDTL